MNSKYGVKPTVHLTYCFLPADGHDERLYREEYKGRTNMYYSRQKSMAGRVKSHGVAHLDFSPSCRQGH